MSSNKFATQVQTKFAAVGYESIKEKLSKKQHHSKVYEKYSPEERLQIGKYVKALCDVSTKKNMGF